jgi:dTDP-4-dehydrorhamnose 3,5-epimerase
MRFIHTSIPDVILIEPLIFGDERGFFMETYRKELFIEVGIPTDFVQDNHSGSRKGTLRGLHYQIRCTQGKLIRVISGEIFDVAVDLRQSSPTFLRWVGTTISAENKLMAWIPKGFAHGLYVLSNWAEIEYKTTDYYAPDWERYLKWNDPDIGIEWPLKEGETPILSERDRNGSLLHEADLFD